MTALTDRMDKKAGDEMYSQCLTCHRLQPQATCDAFPEGIPVAILKNKVDHREPRKGDGGLTYLSAVDRFGKTMTHIFDEPTVRARHRNTGRRDIV
jgi:cytochrome c2